MRPEAATTEEVVGGAVEVVEVVVEAGDVLVLVLLRASLYTGAREGMCVARSSAKLLRVSLAMAGAAA
jgi:hypothetical protein